MHYLHDVHNMNTYRAVDVRPSVLVFNFRTAGRMLMNFGLNIMLLEAIRPSYFSFLTVGNNNIAKARTYEVGVTLGKSSTLIGVLQKQLRFHVDRI